MTETTNPQPKPVSPAFARLQAAAKEASEAAHLHAMRGMKRTFHLCRQYGAEPIPAAKVLEALGLDENANTVEPMSDERAAELIAPLEAKARAIHEHQRAEHRAAVLGEAVGLADRIADESREKRFAEGQGKGSTALGARLVGEELRRAASAEPAAVPSAPADRAALLGAAELEEKPDLNVTRLTGDALNADEQVGPADRAAILREAAERLIRDLYPAVYDDAGQKTAQGVNRAARELLDWADADELRRMADEAQQPETQAAARETVEYFLQAQQDDGTWEDASSFMNAPDWAAERLAAKRAKHPDFPWRMAQRTTTVAVQPLPDCLACRHWRCNGDGPCGALVDAWQRCTCPGPAAVSQPGKEA